MDTTAKDIFIIGEIEQSVTADILADLIDTEWKSEEERIGTLNIYIVSEGGFLRDCFALIDIVNQCRDRHNLKINTFGLGEIASAGFFLFLLGDNRYLFPNCRVFVHEHITVTEEKTYGERLKADNTEEKAVYDSYIKYTAGRLKISIAKTKELLAKKRWLTKKEIKQYKIKTTDTYDDN